MTELEYKQIIAGALTYHKWDIQFHEDRYVNFIPDLSFAKRGVDGWIEVKYSERSLTSLDAIPHYTRGQQNWLIQRGMRGQGHCYLLVGTAGGHFVWVWNALDGVRSMKWDEALRHCFVVAGSPGELARLLDFNVRALG